MASRSIVLEITALADIQVRQSRRRASQPSIVKESRDCAVVAAFAFICRLWYLAPAGFGPFHSGASVVEWKSNVD